MWDLSIEGPEHDYFADGVLVHNKSPVGPCDLHPNPDWCHPTVDAAMPDPEDAGADAGDAPTDGG